MMAKSVVGFQREPFTDVASSQDQHLRGSLPAKKRSIIGQIWQLRLSTDLNCQDRGRFLFAAVTRLPSSLLILMPQAHVANPFPVPKSVQ